MTILHLFLCSSAVYTTEIVRMLETDGRFSGYQNRYILRAELNLEWGRVEVRPEIFDEADLGTLKAMAQGYSLVIFHGLSYRARQLFHLPKSLLRKSIWCVWGHDLYGLRMQPKGKAFSTRFYGMLVNGLLRTVLFPRLRRLAAIATGFPYDAHYAKKLLGSTANACHMPYPTGYDYSKLANAAVPRDGKTVRLMVGHCGFEHLNHGRVLRRLAHLRGQPVLFTLPLNYGQAPYIEALKQDALALFPSRQLEFIEAPMSQLAYTEYLKTIDAAIFDSDIQTGLANIFVLLALDRSVFLRADSPLHKGFTMATAAVHTCDELENLKIDQLYALRRQKTGNTAVVCQMAGHQAVYTAWYQTLESLKGVLG